MRLITLNGVKLLVYLNGMILRYSDKQKGNHLIKGWQDCKGSVRLGYNVVGLNQKYFYRHHTGDRPVQMHRPSQVFFDKI